REGSFLNYLNFLNQNLMAEAPTSLKNKNKETKKMIDEDMVVMVTDSDMEAASHLIQLSDEDSSCNNKKRRRRRRTIVNDDEQRIISHVTWAKIREIFGEDEVSHHHLHLQPKKQKRRYRSLVNIYMATTPTFDA
ncbi:hypothetical protein PIB30_065634, partial [Stylosanthes scabra]|nr:hypothetical protein [Stylosanthes scabra]